MLNLKEIFVTMHTKQNKTVKFIYLVLTWFKATPLAGFNKPAPQIRPTVAAMLTEGR